LNPVQCSRDITNTQFARHSQRSKFLPLSLDVEKLKGFDQGLCSGPRWGLRPQTPVRGSRSMLAMGPVFGSFNLKLGPVYFENEPIKQG